MKGQRIRWAAAGAVAAAVAIGGGALGAAHVLADGTTIHACAQKENGQLRLSPDGTCRSSETAVSWSSGGATSLDALAGTPCTIDGRSGVTYLMSGDGLTRFDVYPQCLRPDGSEPNDARAAAAELQSGVGPTFRTIDPAGDEDWFSATGKALWSFGVYSQAGIAPAGAPFTAELYRDGVQVATAAPRPDGTWALSWYRTDSSDYTPHDWLLHVTSPDVQLYLIQLG